MNKLKFIVIYTLSCLYLLVNEAHAGPDPQPWDSLPKIQSFAFEKKLVGLIANDSSYFILNADEGTLSTVSETEFKNQFPKTTPPAAEIVRDSNSRLTVQLRTSGNRIFSATDGYCAEEQNDTHQLFLDSKLLKDFVDPCTSIRAVEIVGPQLWLGTLGISELAEYGEGIIIQSLDGREKIGQISTKDGLTGDIIRCIRVSPSGSTIWVATNQGINAISKDFKVEKSFYLYQDFDPTTGRPTVLIRPTSYSHGTLNRS